MATVAGKWAHAPQVEVADPFEQLFLAEYPKVVSTAERILGDRAEAEDVAQEVFYAFHKRHPADASYAKPWLHRAATHTALNMVRAKRRRRNHELEESRQSARLGRNEGEQDPLEEFEAAERRVEVRNAMAQLPARSASVLAMRHGGLSYSEIAESLDCSIGQIGTMLRRAEAALKKELQRETH